MNTAGQPTNTVELFYFADHTSGFSHTAQECAGCHEMRQFWRNASGGTLCLDCDADRSVRHAD